MDAVKPVFAFIGILFLIFLLISVGQLISAALPAPAFADQGAAVDNPPYAGKILVACGVIDAEHTQTHEISKLAADFGIGNEVRIGHGCLATQVLVHPDYKDAGRFQPFPGQNSSLPMVGDHYIRIVRK